MGGAPSKNSSELSGNRNIPNALDGLIDRGDGTSSSKSILVRDLIVRDVRQYEKRVQMLSQAQQVRMAPQVLRWLKRGCETKELSEFHNMILHGNFCKIGLPQGNPFELPPVASNILLAANAKNDVVKVVSSTEFDDEKSETWWKLQRKRLSRMAIAVQSSQEAEAREHTASNARILKFASPSSSSTLLLSQASTSTLASVSARFSPLLTNAGLLTDTEFEILLEATLSFPETMIGLELCGSLLHSMHRVRSLEQHIRKRTVLKRLSLHDLAFPSANLGREVCRALDSAAEIHESSLLSVHFDQSVSQSDPFVGAFFDAVGRLTKKCTNLAHLSMSFRKESFLGKSSLAQTLEEEHANALSGMIQTITSSGCAALQELSLVGMGLGQYPFLVSTLVQYLKSPGRRLVHLDLSHNMMNSDVTLWLAEGFTERKDTVGDRLLSFFYIGNRCSGAGVAALCDAFAHHPRLIQLDLSENLGKAQGAQGLAGLLNQNKRIKHIGYNYNECPLAEAVSIANAIRQSSNLEYIAFVGNHVQDMFLRGICDALRSPTCAILALNLESNSFSGNAVLAFARALAFNRSLCYLALERGNGGEVVLYTRIRNQLKKNLARRAKYSRSLLIP
eukprot:ANDGO_02635.mRNA.1 hypothetical protein SAMD00019534_002530